MNLSEILDKSALDVENSQDIGQLGQARSQLLREDDENIVEFQSPFSNRGLFTQQE